MRNTIVNQTEFDRDRFVAAHFVLDQVGKLGWEEIELVSHALATIKILAPSEYAALLQKFRENELHLGEALR